MVSWGTTANVSMPVGDRPARPAPAGPVVSRAADGGWLIEGGLSARPARCSPGWAGSPGGPVRRAGRAGPAEPAGCPRGGGRALARRGPGPVVARRRPGRLRRPAPRPRTGRPGPGRVRVGGLGGRRGASRRWPSSGRPGRRRPGSRLGGAGTGVAVWADVLTGITGLPGSPPPIGRGGLGRGRPAGRAGPWAWTAPRPPRPGGRRIDPDPVAVAAYRACGPSSIGLAAGRSSTGRRSRRHAGDPTPGPADAGDPGLRPRRARGRRARRRGGGASPTEPPALADEAGPCAAALREPLSGPRLADLVGPGGTVAVVFPDLTRPMPNTHRAAAPAGRAGAGRGRPRPGRAAVRHRHPPPGHRRRRWPSWSAPTSLGRYRIHQHRADDGRHVVVGRVDGTPILLDRRYVEADRAHRHRLRRAPLLRRLERRPQGGLPGTGRHRHHPGGPQPGRASPTARATWTAHRGQPGARVRAAPPPPCARRTCRST